MRPRAAHLSARLLLHELGSVQDGVRQVSATEHPAATLHASRLRLRHDERQQAESVWMERRNDTVDERNVRAESKFN